MTMIIVSLLLLIGAWADPQLPVPVQALQNHSEFINYSDNGSASIVSPDQYVLQGNQGHGNNRGIVNESFKQLLVKSRAPEVPSNVHSVCHHPFVAIGTSCYYFSTEAVSFSRAMDYCQSLSYGHQLDVTLAMLDFDNDEDIALMGEVATREITYWVGGTTSDGLTWKWVDDRIIEQLAPFWYTTEPDTPNNNCLTVQATAFGNVKRAHIFDSDCSESLNYICQTGCPEDFVRIGSECYFRSAELGIPKLPFYDARKYCTSMLMPEGYHGDLAVLGLQGQDSYDVMINLVWESTTLSWLGLYEEANCQFKWIDNRTLPDNTFYWKSNEPNCGGDSGVFLDYLPSYKNRVFLADGKKTGKAAFVCQMFKDAY